MSNFTDDEDRQLVQLASVFESHGRQIVWDQLAQQMKSSSQSKHALRQRLKTLKRTHGKDIQRFPVWYFRKPFVNAINPHWLTKTCFSTRMNLHNSANNRNNTVPTRPTPDTNKNATPCVSNPPNTNAFFHDRVHAVRYKRAAQPSRRTNTRQSTLRSIYPSSSSSSLLLLASVAVKEYEQNPLSKSRPLSKTV